MAEQKKQEYIVGQKYTVPLSLVDADYNWNARQGNWRTSTGDEEKDNDFADLKRSIRDRGQDTACTVVATGKANKPFGLIEGFRRHAAITDIAEETKNKTPTIDIILKVLDEAGMRSLNIRENTARNNLKAADLAFAIFDLEQIYKKAGAAVTDVALASEIGKNQSYITLLLRIMRKVKPTILKAWREGAPANIRDMEALSKMPLDEQDAAWKLILASKVPADSAGRGPDAWKDSVKKKATSIAYLLGQLVKAKLIKLGTINLAEIEHLQYLGIKPKKGKKLPKAVATAAQKAFDKAMGEPDITIVEEEDDDSEEE